MHQVASDQNEYFGHKSKKPGFLCQRLLEQMNDFHLKYIFDKNQIYCIYSMPVQRQRHIWTIE